MVRHYVAKRSRSGKSPDWLIGFFTKRSQFGLSYGQALCSETKPIRGGPDWLIAFFTKRSQFGLGCLIPCSKVFNCQRTFATTTMIAIPRAHSVTTHTSNPQFHFYHAASRIRIGGASNSLPGLEILWCNPSEPLWYGTQGQFGRASSTEKPYRRKER